MNGCEKNSEEDNGPEVNLFVDHSQIVQLETLRRGIWGTKSLWGRVLTYKE
jgi:phosphosulfolactate synthase (CoM biosynthesis protein A)